MISDESNENQEPPQVS